MEIPNVILQRDPSILNLWTPETFHFLIRWEHLLRIQVFSV